MPNEDFIRKLADQFVSGVPVTLLGQIENAGVEVFILGTQYAEGQVRFGAYGFLCKASWWMQKEQDRQDGDEGTGENFFKGQFHKYQLQALSFWGLI